MRRLPVLCLAILTLCGAAPAFAQTTATKNVGVTAGLGIGYGAVPEGTSRDMEPTFNIGAVAVLPFSENWAFQPELKFDRRKITVGDIPTEVSYLSLPIMLRSKFRGIYMVQGLSINTVISASIFDQNFKDAITSPDVALVIGAGKRFDRWSLEGRWETGFRSFQKDIAFTGVKLRSLTAVATVYLK
jgi:hypothetical protein